MQQRITNPASKQDEAALLQINVSLADGTHFIVNAAPGYRIMELVRAYGLPIKAECGGSGICATCHIRVGETWQSALAPPSEDEIAKLDEIPGADDQSRLACQIVMTENLDGLEVELQPDSLQVHTSWIAG